ncbi:hypothetical protein BIW22_20880 [Salmonella enterica]|nr:hypothetical protein [Salmonella enterica]EFO7976604.1 hypothetical protein [Salmonella enterica]
MAILVESGRAAVATAILNQPIHLAWGSGDPAWDGSKPVESTGTTKMVKEIGRRTVTQTMYVTPSATGEIVVSQGRFHESQAPTKYLYLRFTYDFLDAAQETIRELGIFVGTKIIANPAQIDYFQASEIADPGQLLVLELIDKLNRSQQTKQQFEFVIQF